MKFILFFICGLIQQSLQESLINELVTYENKILDAFVAPNPKKGITLTEDIDWYNKQLVHISHICRNRDHEKYKKENPQLDKFIHMMWNKGGPEFLKLEMNKTNLLEKFKWSEDTLEEMSYSLSASFILWGEVKELYPSEVQSFNKSDFDEILQLDKQGRLNELYELTKLGNMSGDLYNP